MFKHVAEFDGETFTRDSKSRQYAFALVGRRWKDVRREYDGFTGRRRVRSKFKTIVNHEAGVDDRLHLIGWSRDRDTAERRRQTELASGYAEVHLVSASVEEVVAKTPRPWHLRTYAIITNEEYQSASSYRLRDSGHQIIQLGKRARTFETREDAERVGNSLFIAGKIDGFAVSKGHGANVLHVQRGSAAGFSPTSYTATHEDQIEFRYTMDTRVGLDCVGLPDFLDRQPVQTSQADPE